MQQDDWNGKYSFLSWQLDIKTEMAYEEDYSQGKADIDRLILYNQPGGLKCALLSFLHFDPVEEA